MFDNASLDIKSYNVGEVVKANAHEAGGNSFIEINTTGTVNIEFGCDDLEHTNPRAFRGYASSDSKNFVIKNVGYMSIARNGYRTENVNDPDRFDFVAYPGITVSESLTVKKFTDDRNIIMHGRLESGASIGLHTHEGNCEMFYIIEGTGKVLMDGEYERVEAGVCHYCPKGHTHSLINDSDSDLVFFAVVAEQK